MGIRDRLFARLADQLGGPHGVAGRLLAGRLNEANRTAIAAAVDTLDPDPGETVADVGFGGGLGLELLAERVAPGGAVHGIDPMADMLARYRRKHAAEVDAGRVVLAEGTLAALGLPDASLDGCISCNTIYFEPDLPGAVTELSRVLRPGGRAVLGLADAEDLAQRPFADHGFILRPLEEVLGTVTKHGLIDPRVDDIDIGRGRFHLVSAERPR